MDDPAYEHKKAEYEAALIKYQSDLAEYRGALARWHSLSPEEQMERNMEAEAGSRALWSKLLAGAAAIAFYFYLQGHLKGDSFWWAWSSGSLAVLMVLVSLSAVIGFLARTLFFTASGYMVGIVGMSILRDNVSNPPSARFGLIVSITIAVVGFLLGISYRATAEPHPPARPRPP